MTQDILKDCTVEGLVVKLPPGQLERNVYLEIKKKLELIGGKWKGGKTQGFVFEEDPSELLGAVANGDDRNLKKEFQFFATPPELAKKMVDMLPSTKGMVKVLEPSAGDGALVKAFTSSYSHPDQIVDCYELMDLNRMKLAKLDRVKICGDDFLQCASFKQCHYDIIIANPPFTKNQDIDHIRKMYEVCKPGGMIVTLASPSWTIGSQKKQIEFREWLDEIGAEREEIDAGTFKDSGTTIRTILLKIHKSVYALPVPEKPNPKIYFSDEELKEFKCLLNEKLTTAEKELDYLRNLISNKTAPESVNLANPGKEIEELIQMRIRQEKYIANIHHALERIENKTFGICRITGKLIDKARLRAVPTATLSIEAKKGYDTTSKPVKKPEPKKRSCRVCGCTDDNCIQCIEKTGSPCHWIEEDLCSACQEITEPEFDETPEEKEKVVTADDSPEDILKSIVNSHKQAEKYLSELQKMISPENNNDMNFFQQLFEQLDGIDLSLNIKRKNGKLTLSVLPQTAGTISPALITGTPEELDEGFFDAVKAPIAEAKGLNVSLANLEASIKTAKEKKEADLKEANKKPAEKSSDNSTAKGNKKDAKSSAKKIEANPKEKPVKDETPKPAVPDLFANV